MIYTEGTYNLGYELRGDAFTWPGVRILSQDRWGGGGEEEEPTRRPPEVTASPAEAGEVPPAKEEPPIGVEDLPGGESG